MPAEQGVWLHDHKSLLPGSNQPGQQNEKDAIGVRACGPFHLAPEDNELLAQKGIFGDELGLASAKIGQGCQYQGDSERFGPTSKVRGECIQATILQPVESGENTTHTRSFSIT